MKKLFVFVVFSVFFCSGQAVEPPADCTGYTVPTGTLLPDLMTVVPQQIGLQNAHQKEIIRFSNSIANLGEGLWWLEPEFPGVTDINQVQSAYQVFSSASIVTDPVPPADTNDVLGRCKAGEFAFHPSHNHWHINNVAEFKVCPESSFDTNKLAGHPDQCTAASGPNGVAASVKVTSCLIDWYKLGENTATSDPTRNFWECATSFQGITPGWVDQYHHSTPDQQIDITKIPAGIYYLVTTSNYNLSFRESDTTNNTSWVKLQLTRNNNRHENLKIIELSNACTDGSGYREDQLYPAVDNFTSDEDLRTKIKDQMCGNMSSNK